ncbi:MAG: hypothetical protein Satyrvirus15_18 [Satyrvirus sp.]|uniref:Uncharacterized protein n=1 Tax=Satyrvirus sp. TaxID=2487771 RepID=A0A3G5AGJ8_9VIRU|nr:MAG: hypothetical protein Satyrvirus15_18 [Satyrvirus sp.]
MGYNTEFKGCFKLNKPLDKKTRKLINGLSRTRRMKRDLTKLEMTFEEAAQYGIDGELYCPAKTNLYGQDNDNSILDYNIPPYTQPGLWCCWNYNKDKNCIEWNGVEKFYYYVSWLKYLIERILEPEYKLNGEMKYKGEDKKDSGTIYIVQNEIKVEPSNPNFKSSHSMTMHNVLEMVKNKYVYVPNS